MISAVNSINHNVYKKQNTAFGENSETEKTVQIPRQAQTEIQRKKPSKAGVFTKYLTTQIIAGALFSAIWDGATNLTRLISKKKELMPVKEIVQRAGVMGVLFALVGLVFSGVAAMLTKRNRD